MNIFKSVQLDQLELKNIKINKINLKEQKGIDEKKLTINYICIYIINF